jgi:vacuolar protein sorting-associated protein VTA1
LKYARWKAADIVSSLRRGGQDTSADTLGASDSNFSDVQSSLPQSSSTQPSFAPSTSTQSSTPFNVHPTSQPPQPQPQNHHQNSFPSPPTSNSFNSAPTPTPKATNPAPTNYSPPPQQVQPSYSYPVPPTVTSHPPSNSVPVQPGMQVTEDDIITAQKYARFAVSALNFDDVPSAIQNLQTALRILTKSS